MYNSERYRTRLLSCRLDRNGHSGIVQQIDDDGDLAFLEVNNGSGLCILLSSAGEILSVSDSAGHYYDAAAGAVHLLGDKRLVCPMPPDYRPLSFFFPDASDVPT